MVFCFLSVSCFRLRDWKNWLVGWIVQSVSRSLEEILRTDMIFELVLEFFEALFRIYYIFHVRKFTQISSIIFTMIL